MKKLLIAAAAALIATACTADLEIVNPAPDDNVFSALPEGSVTRLTGTDTPEMIDPISQLQGVKFKLKAVKNGYYLWEDYKFYISDTQTPGIFYFERHTGNMGEVSGLKSGSSRYFPAKPISVSKMHVNANPAVYKFESKNGNKEIYELTTITDNIKYCIDDRTVFRNEARIHTRKSAEGWQIIPDEQFQLINIRYAFTFNDRLNVVPKYYSTRSLSNNTDTPATRTIEVSETITESSTFSELEGFEVKTTLGSTSNVKFPLFTGGINFNETYTSSFSYTQGGTETQSYTFKETVVQEVPPAHHLPRTPYRQPVRSGHHLLCRP